MSFKSENIIDFKSALVKDDAPVFSSALYNWMMFLINFYNRVKKDLKIDFDSFMILQLVVSDSLYKVNKEGAKNYKELKKTFEDSSNLFNDKRKVNIASIAEIINLPRETVRRKILNLSKIKLLNYNKTGISIGDEYQKVFNKFVPETVTSMSKLVRRWEEDGSLNKLLNIKNNI
tara:strand:+ start:600 stop:1124 length:525 start_codon:yes stop_codon:yes gene_type:complete